MIESTAATASGPNAPARPPPVAGATGPPVS